MDDDVLIEELGKVLEASQSSIPWREKTEEEREIARDLARATLPVVKAAQAEAWGYGYNCGEDYARWNEWTANPYEED